MKRALLIGINAYASAPLRGCLNDVQAMHSILTSKFEFEQDNIRVLTDERATKAGILSRMDWLINGARAGDVCVMHFSGHGSQVRDRNGDELKDNLDEILCSFDNNWDDPLSDDIIADRLAKIPHGVFFTAIFDCCHSGTATRNMKPPDTHPTFYRFMPAPLDITLRTNGRKLPVSHMGTMRDSRGNGKGKDLNHVLISGCKSDQTSADAHINGKYQGALTWALVKTLEENTAGISYTALKNGIQRYVKQSNFSQDPQLEGPVNLIQKSVFSTI